MPKRTVNTVHVYTTICTWILIAALPYWCQNVETQMSNIWIKYDSVSSASILLQDTVICVSELLQFPLNCFNHSRNIYRHLLGWFSFFSFFWPHWAACGMWDLKDPKIPPGTEPRTLAVKAQSLTMAHMEFCWIPCVAVFRYWGSAVNKTWKSLP